MAPPAAARGGSWGDATDVAGAPALKPSKAATPSPMRAPAPPPPKPADAGPTRRDEAPVERVRTEARAPQPSWDEVIARAPSDALRRLNTSRAAEAETQINQRPPVITAPPLRGSEDRTLLEPADPSSRRPPVAIPTDADHAAPSFIDITERQPPSLHKPKPPTVLAKSSRNMSDTLPPFEAPTVKPARPSAPAAQRPAPAAPKAVLPSRPAPARTSDTMPPTRVDVPRDATLKGVVMAEAEGPVRREPALQNAPVNLRPSKGLADDLDLPPSRPSEQSASDLGQATMFGVLTPDLPSQSMGGQTRVAAKDALAGAAPSRGSVPAFGKDAERRRDMAPAADLMPWEVSDPEATPQLDFERQARPKPADSALGIGDLSLPGEPMLGVEMSAVEVSLGELGDVRIVASGLFRRWLSMFIDVGLVSALVVTPAAFGLFGARLSRRELLTLDGFTNALRDGELLLPLAVFVALLFLGSLVFRLSLGRTPGEWIMRIALVRSRDAEKPGTTRIVLRSLFGLLSLALAGAGYFFIILDRRSRTLHDVLTGVTMIKGRPIRHDA